MTSSYAKISFHIFLCLEEPIDIAVTEVPVVKLYRNAVMKVLG